MRRFQGILYAVVSSTTFGFAPLFSLLLLGAGYSSFEVLSYRWGVAALALGTFGFFAGRDFRLSGAQLRTVCLLGVCRAATSLSLIIAYQNIASGIASTIHFMYPLAVVLAMICFFGEKGSVWVFTAIGVSVGGAVLLSSGGDDLTRGDTAVGLAAACVSVVSYATYIVGVRKTRAAQIDSVVLTTCVMGFGALLFVVGSVFTGGLRLETDPLTWGCILALALPATALSNMALVLAVKRIGPTLTSVFGALEPLTAVAAGILVFAEPFTRQGAAGIVLIIAAVTTVILRSGK